MRYLIWFQDYENNPDFLKKAHHVLMEIEIINGDLVGFNLDSENFLLGLLIVFKLIKQGIWIEVLVKLELYSYLTYFQSFEL